MCDIVVVCGKTENKTYYYDYYVSTTHPSTYQPIIYNIENFASMPDANMNYTQVGKARVRFRGAYRGKRFVVADNGRRTKHTKSPLVRMHY